MPLSDFLQPVQTGKRRVRPPSRYNKENISAPINERAICLNSKGFNVPAYKTDQYKNSFFVCTVIQWNYLGYVDGEESLQKFEEDLRIESSLIFSTMALHTRDCASKAKKLRYTGEGTLHWSSNAGDVHIPFMGIPFLLHAVTLKECMYGVDHHKEKDNPPEAYGDHSDYGKSKKKRFYIQPSVKRGCRAVLRIREAKIFSDYKLPNTDGLKAYQVKSLKKDTLNRLRTDISNGTATSISRYYIHCPAPDAHNHALDSLANLCAQPVHPDVVEKIHDLVARGIDNVREVKAHLREYIRNVMFRDKPLPDQANQGFYPTNKNIRNHINRATIQHKHSTKD
ncbi:PREDICTED: calcium-responsive transcription factor-like [Priapulus caudatus]|uniref:Calcium-responsive transcription factor-like n=1 Tax=Priapulus caudatus TaxID=37621 RepID=A0ABM1EMM0_PRICU|nr:PREDICTED: calcium-responsive transcription factor-like [Priapulus caudatus]